MTNNLSKKAITRRDSKTVNRYLKELSHYPVMSKEEQKKLFLQLQEDPSNQEIRNKIFLGTMRFVVTIAKQYDNKGIELEDLISIGNIGLIKAIGQFDVNNGAAFTTYAAHWIRKEILKELEETQVYVRIPDNQIKKVNKAKTFISQFYQKNEREPNEFELSEGLNVTEETAKDVLNLIDYQNASNVVEDEGKVLSIFDTMIGDTAEYDFGFLDDILQKNLTEREYKVIKVFFFSNSREQEKLAKELGLTVRRLAQIKDKVLIKLKNSPELIEFYNG